MEYQIGDFSKITRLSIKTLRYYHEYGLMSPSRVDQLSGYRYYDEHCLEKARIISKLKELGFTLNEIRGILETCTDDTEINSHIENKLKEINQKISDYRKIQNKLNSFLKQKGEIKMNNSEIVIKDIPEMLIASLRFKGSYHEIGSKISELYKLCGRYAKGQTFSLYYDCEYKEEDADIEVCIEVSKEEIKGATTRVLKGGKFVVTAYQGPYEQIGQGYKHLVDYINQNNIKTDVPSREVYIKGPGMIFKGNPEKYLTEIQMMIL